MWSNTLCSLQYCKDSSSPGIGTNVKNINERKKLHLYIEENNRSLRLFPGYILLKTTEIMTKDENLQQWKFGFHTIIKLLNVDNVSTSSLQTLLT